MCLEPKALEISDSGPNRGTGSKGPGHNGGLGLLEAAAMDFLGIKGMSKGYRFGGGQEHWMIKAVHLLQHLR